MAEFAIGRDDGGDRFDLRRRLGAGGMGVVYEAFDKQRNEIVALKKLLQHDAAAIYRLKQEFRSLADVAHPNLVSLYELVNRGEDWFFTMELVRGMTFLTYVRPSTGWVDPPPATGRDETIRDDDRAPTLRQDSSDSAPHMTPAVYTSSFNTPSFHTPSFNTPAPGLTPNSPLTPPPMSPMYTPTPNTPAPIAQGECMARIDVLRPALQQLVEGVAALHRAGKLHRDLKPPNVLVTPDRKSVV